MKLIANLSKTARIMLAAVCAVCFALLILGLIVIFFVYPFEKPLQFSCGIVIGCVQSLLKTILLEKSIDRVIEAEKESSVNISRLHALGRYFLTAAAFGAVIIFPGIFGLFGAILGVLSLQPAAIVANLILKKQKLT